MKTLVQVFKWGDDLAIELPPALVKQLALKEGDDIEIVEADASSDDAKEPED